MIIKNLINFYQLHMLTDMNFSILSYCYVHTHKCLDAQVFIILPVLQQQKCRHLTPNRYSL